MITQLQDSKEYTHEIEEKHKLRKQRASRNPHNHALCDYHESWHSINQLRIVHENKLEKSSSISRSRSIEATSTKSESMT